MRNFKRSLLSSEKAERHRNRHISVNAWQGRKQPYGRNARTPERIIFVEGSFSIGLTLEHLVFDEFIEVLDKMFKKKNVDRS